MINPWFQACFNYKLIDYKLSCSVFWSLILTSNPMAFIKKRQGKTNRHSCNAIPAIYLSNTHSWLVDNNLAWFTKEWAMSCCWRAIVQSPLKLTAQFCTSSGSDQDMRTWIFQWTCSLVPLRSHLNAVVNMTAAMSTHSVLGRPPASL